MKKHNNIITYLTIIGLIILSIIFFILGLIKKTSSNFVYTYKIEKNSNYTALLKPNIFYDTKYLSSNKYYASKSIENFIINFDYDYKSNLKTNFNCNYNITAEIVGRVNGSEYQGEEIWNKKFLLMQKNITNENKSNFNINEIISINYDTYNNIVNAFEEEYEIDIEANLSVKLNLDYEIINSKIINYFSNNSSLNCENNKFEDCIEILIPLTNNVTWITENYEKTNTNIKDINHINLYRENIKIIYFSVSLFFAICTIIFLFSNKIKNQNSIDSLYKNKINKILNYYKELIIFTNSIPDINGLKIIEVLSIEDLINVATQRQHNVIYYEVIKNKESNFYIFDNNFVYLFIIKK